MRRGVLQTLAPDGGIEDGVSPSTFESATFFSEARDSPERLSEGLVDSAINWAAVLQLKEALHWLVEEGRGKIEEEEKSPLPSVAPTLATT